MNWIVTLGIAIIFIGFFIVFTGSIYTSKQAATKTGGIIFIGPIPLVFGTDAESAQMAMILGIILVVLSFLIFLGGYGWKF